MGYEHPWSGRTVDCAPWGTVQWQVVAPLFLSATDDVGFARKPAYIEVVRDFSSDHLDNPPIRNLLPAGLLASWYLAQPYIVRRVGPDPNENRIDRTP